MSRDSILRNASKLMPLRGLTYMDALDWAESAFPGLIVKELSLPGSLCGAYDLEDNVVFVDRLMDGNQKRVALAHELAHMLSKDPWCRNMGRMELAADRTGALALISPVEYEACERIYAGNMAMMAKELGVTVRLVGVYRGLLSAWRKM